MTLPRVRCVKCGRAVASTDGHIYASVADADGNRFPYVYLRRHNATPGVPCGGFSAQVDTWDEAEL